MGYYLNPGLVRFTECINSQIYVDKSQLIGYLNRVISTEQKYVCVSRPRRFGKSMAVDMLAAYYGRGGNADHLFANLDIQKDISYQEHLNRYDVLRINMQEFLSKSGSIDEMLGFLQKRILKELKAEFSQLDLEEEHIDWGMQDIFIHTGRQFVILIDEWDCLFREYKNDLNSQKKYLDFLRMWLKDQSTVALVYMTGILPIKKYGTHSALNMFNEFSMSEPGELAPYFGFMEHEVRNLCDLYKRNFEEAKDWYDGYIEHITNELPAVSIYNPKSVVEAMLRRNFGTYWNRTETYEALKVYLQLNFDGLRDSVISLLAGGSIDITITKFQNDMTTFSDKDDVLTLLVHLGYLTYNSITKSVSIPNREVREEWMNAVSSMDGFETVAKAVMASKTLLQDLWELNEDAVANGIDKAHQELSILQYNDENALSYTITLAFYYAREYYTIVRELPAGKGYADVCFLPKRKYRNKPALLIELKWNQSATTALNQIEEREYRGALYDYKDNLILVGINYNRKTKKHECKIVWNQK